MLEMIFFATEPFGTWGPGPTPDPVGWWARLLDSLANDPQAVAIIFAAFLGFLGGALIKYALDRRFDRLRRDVDLQILATALRAELVRMDAECKSRIEAFEEKLKEGLENQRLVGPHTFVRLMLPPRRVWTAHLDRIGELKGVDAEGLILVHAGFDSHNLAIETFKQQFSEQGISREALQHTVDNLCGIREAMGIVLVDLIKLTITTVRPS